MRFVQDYCNQLVKEYFPHEKSYSIDEIIQTGTLKDELQEMDTLKEDQKDNLKAMQETVRGRRKI